MRLIQRGVESAAGVFFASNVCERPDLINDSKRSNKLLRFGTVEEAKIQEVQKIPDSFTNVPDERSIDQPFLCVLPNATLAGPQPLVRAQSGNVVLESADSDFGVFEHRAVELLRSKQMAGLRFLAGKDVTTDEELGHVFPLTWHPTTNYYHWLLTDLLKVRALEAYREKGNDPTILISPNPPSWVSESLHHFGVDPSNCKVWDDSIASVRKLILPYHRQTMGKLETGPEDCHWLRERAMNALQEPLSSDNRKLFISRSDADCRRIKNRDELEATFEEYGLEKHQLSNLTFEEQVRLFAEAEAVVAPHGAGLANIVFGEDLSILELLPRDENRPMYFQLAHELEHEYNFQLCDRSKGDLIVDVPGFRKRLDQILD